MAIKNILGNPNVRNYIAATKQPVNVMNTNKRGSASIVIDTSGSMNPYRDLLKRLICEFYDDVLKDPIASNILELSIITFNSDVFIVVLVQPGCSGQVVRPVFPIPGQFLCCLLGEIKIFLRFVWHCVPPFSFRV